jgi:hypothetical protein
VFEIYGSWRLMSTLTLPNRVALVGLGGASPQQFQANPIVAGIIPPSGNTPAIRITGSNDTLIRNIVISGGSGIGILVGGDPASYGSPSFDSGLHALARLEGVGVSVSNVSTAIPLVIDTHFWDWISQCVFLAGSNNLASIRITQTYGVPYLYSGLNRIDDCRLSGRGILFDIQTASGGSVGGTIINRVEYENATNGFVTIDPHNADGIVGDIQISDCLLADALANVYVIDVIGTPTNQVKKIRIKDNGGLQSVAGTIRMLRSAVSIPDLIIDHTAPYEQYELDVGAAQRDLLLLGPRATRPGMHPGYFSPSTLPVAPFFVRDDTSTWTLDTSSGTGTLTTGQLDPMGGTTAAKAECASGAFVGASFFPTAATNVSVGDFVIYGAWFKAADPTKKLSAEVYLNVVTDGAFRFDGNTYVVFGQQNLAPLGSGWIPQVGMSKVTALTTPGASVYFSMSARVAPDRPTVIWQPFALVLSASAGWTEKDAIRLKEHLSVVVDGAPAGSVALKSYQKLQFGADTNLYRRAANNLATDDDFEITDTTKGVILKSPNGSRYRLSVSNAGVISATLIP